MEVASLTKYSRETKERGGGFVSTGASTAVTVVTSGSIENTELSYVLNVRSFWLSCHVSAFKVYAPSEFVCVWRCEQGNAR